MCVGVCKYIYTHTYTHKHNGVSFNHEKEFLPFVTMWTDLEDIMINMISETEKDKSFILIQNLKKADLIETEQNGGYQRLGDGEIREMLFKGTSLQLIVKFWRSNAQYSEYR